MRKENLIQMIQKIRAEAVGLEDSAENNERVTFV